MPAIEPHHTATTDGDWDTDEFRRRVRSGEEPEYYEAIFAWRDPDGDPTVKSSYKGIHHVVDSDGNPGPAHVTACKHKIYILNGMRGGMKVPESDRRAIWEHLATHLRDAGEEVPELKALEAAVAHGATEIKRFDFEAKADDLLEGVIRGVASLYDVLDLQGDIVMKGAFADSVKGRPEVPLLWEHDPKCVIGKARLAETDEGLELIAALDTADETAVKVLRKVKEGYIRGLSIGYTVDAAEWAEMDGRPVRKLTRVSVWEVSVVTLPALPDARIVEARSADLARPAAANKEAEVEKLDELRAELREEIAAMKRYINEITSELKRPAAHAAAQPMTIGRMVAEHKGVRELATSPTQGAARVEVGRFDYKTVTRPSPVTTPVPTEFTGQVVGRMTAVRRLRDVIPVAKMGGAAIQFLRQSNRTLASPVAEGNQKPGSTITYQAVVVTARTLSHYIKVPKQFLADVEALEERIQNELLEGLADIEDYEILYGDGSGEHLEGIWSAAANATMSYLPPSPTAIDRIGAMMAELEAIGYRPDTIIINSANWRQLTMLKHEAGYYLGGPAQTGDFVLWGCNVVATPAMTPGQVLVGQARGNVVLYDREESNVQVSNVDADDLTRNRYTVLAEERVALAIYQPLAWLRGTLSSE